MPEGRYVSRIFYTELNVGGPGMARMITREGNLLGYTYRDPGEPVVWNHEYRFRYYVDDILDDHSKDESNWYHVRSQPGDPLEKLMPTIRNIFSVAGGGKFEEVVVESANFEVFFQRLTEQPWAHTKIVTKKEFEGRRAR